MEIKITLIITVILCFSNTAFFIAYDGKKSAGEDLTSDKLPTAVFYKDERQDVEVVLADEEVTDEANVPEETVQEEPVNIAPPVNTYKPVAPPPSSEPTQPVEDEPESPPSDPPPTPPSDEQDPIGGGPDPFDDIGGEKG